MGYRLRWVAVLTAVLFAVLVGVAAYNAGVSHGLAVAAPAAERAPGAVTPFYGYRPWGFGFGFFPLGFVLFWLLVLRVGFWGGCRRRYGYYRWRDEGPSSFDEWHRRAHERMAGPPREQGQGTV